MFCTLPIVFEQQRNSVSKLRQFYTQCIAIFQSSNNCKNLFIFLVKRIEVERKLQMKFGKFC